MIKVYRKTGTIKAERFDCSDEMVNRYGLIDRGGHVVDGLHVDNMCFIPTLEGQMKINVHDWIATGVNGEHWPITNDVFNKTYAELPVIPDYVADYIDMAKNGKTRLHNTDVIQASIDVMEYGGGSIKLTTWIDDNGDAFARAWLDGYQVEENK